MQETSVEKGRPCARCQPADNDGLGEKEEIEGGVICFGRKDVRNLVKSCLLWRLRRLILRKRSVAATDTYAGTTSRSGSRP